MLLREDDEGLIAIAQPAHAWVSGQMGRAWGNDLFGDVEPFEETCLGAEQHDCGWLGWERRPALNPETGRPFTVFEVHGSDHFQIWTTGPRLAAIQNPYAGLLVSLHGTGLYARFRSHSTDPEVMSFMASEEAHQNELIRLLAQDPRYARHVAPEALKRNQALLATWDLLSLHFCLRGAPRRQVQGVPGREHDIDIELRRVEGETYSLDPWPFRHDSELLVVTGRRLAPTSFASEDAMRDTLERAPFVNLEFRLERGGAAG